MPNFCSNCGERLNENQVFCTKCGSSVQQTAAPQQQPYQPPYQQPYPPQYPQPTSNHSPVPIILGVVGIIFAILLPIIAYPCAIVGLVLGARSRPANTVGVVLSVIALLIALINSLLGVMLALTGITLF